MRVAKRNQLGKFLSNLRIEEDERIIDMADRLHVSTAYISAISTSKRNIAKDVRDKIIKEYELNKIEIDLLDEAIKYSPATINIKSLDIGEEYKLYFLIDMIDSLKELNQEDIHIMDKIIKKYKYHNIIKGE